jgi:hypothetical protein
MNLPCNRIIADSTLTRIRHFVITSRSALCFSASLPPRIDATLKNSSTWIMPSVVLAPQVDH